MVEHGAALASPSYLTRRGLAIPLWLPVLLTRSSRRVLPPELIRSWSTDHGADELVRLHAGWRREVTVSGAGVQGQHHGRRNP